MSNKTPLLPSLAPPPLHYLTLRHCYLPIPRDKGTTQMGVKGTVEGMVEGAVEGAVEGVVKGVVEGMMADKTRP